METKSAVNQKTTPVDAKAKGKLPLPSKDAKATESNVKANSMPQTPQDMENRKSMQVSTDPKISLDKPKTVVNFDKSPAKIDQSPQVSPAKETKPSMIPKPADLSQKPQDKVEKKPAMNTQAKSGSPVPPLKTSPEKKQEPVKAGTVKVDKPSTPAKILEQPLKKDLALPELAKPVTAKPELASVKKEEPPKVEPAKTEPVKQEPAKKVEPPKTVPVKQAEVIKPVPQQTKPIEKPNVVSQPVPQPKKSSIPTNNKDGPNTKLQDTPPVHAEAPSNQLNRVYFTTRFNEKGELEGYHKKKQFIIPVNSEVRFHLDCGIKISKNARLLINKPKRISKNGDMEYTITQPFAVGEEESLSYKGSQLDKTYLEMVESETKSSKYSLLFRISFCESGSFFVQIAYDDPSQPEGESYTKPMYINVSPQMNLNGQIIECKQLSLMTVQSRQLGKLDRWPKVLQNAVELGYNAIHFTPFQVYGESNSHYSLADQTEVDDYFFNGTVDKKTKNKMLAQTIQQLRQNGMLSIVDIVLNHTANNSQWIVDHPEATYNTDDCPHLWSAWLLDEALQKFSVKFSKKEVPDCPYAPYIKTEADLAKLLVTIRKQVIDPLKMHEFFLCDVQKVMREDFIPAIQNIESQQAEQFKIKFDQEGWMLKPKLDVLKDHLTVGHGGKGRMGVSLKMPEAAIYFMVVNKRNKSDAQKEVEKLLCQLNDQWMAKLKGYLNEAMGSLEGNIKYHKVEQKKSQITVRNQLVEPYFTELKNAQKSKVAHNGWIMGHNCMEDFGMIGFHYLRRTINVWGDCIKLNYGKCPADSPYLWKHMTQYCQDMASIADGFRLDNTHSTPIHACQYLLQAARSKNKNLFVMAELFTSSAELDAMFCQKLNLNGLVRELQNRNDTRSCGDYFHSITCRDAVLGMIDESFKDIKDRPFKVLTSREPEDIIYDCTHDNPSVVDKFQTGRMALPHLGLNSLSDKAIATTWGYDQLVHKQIHCVEEKRLYPIENQSDIVKNILDENEKIEVQESQQSEMPEVELKPFSQEIKVNITSASSVALAHSFNNWKPDLMMKKVSGSQWQLSANMPAHAAGQKVFFKFVVDGKNWIHSNDLPTETDNHNNTNNVLQLSGQGGFLTQESSGQFASKSKIQGALQQRTFNDIRYARCIMNQIHLECTRSNASIFLHQQTEDVLVVTRQLEMDKYADFDSYISITRFCFYNKGGDVNYKQSIELPGFMGEVMFAGFLEIPDSVYNDPKLNSNKEGEFIYGPKGCKLQSFNQIEGKFCTRERISDHNEKLNFHFMPPSFTCILKVKSRSFVKEAVQKLNQISKDTRVKKLFSMTPMAGLNHILYRCDEEEKDISNGKRGTYGLKSTGAFPYAGISSYIYLLKRIKKSKDMGSELFDNIRQGDWLIDFTLERLKSYQAQEPSIGLQKVVSWLDEYFTAAKKLPTYLKPKYVSRIIETLYYAVSKEIMCKRILDEYMADAEDPFIQNMALGIFQYISRIPSVYFSGHKDTMCAGLPHFSTGYVRCWGRDTFISLRGLLITPGFDKEARDIILFFAKVYRHGLLPNLHDGGNNTRFNSRDAPWFFLQAIKDYCLLSDEGNKFLQETFELNFRDDDRQLHLRKTSGRTLSILDLIIEIVQRHCQGIEFREWNAGTAIDAHMKSNGFDVKITCDLEKTGFCFGGNRDNCGTWMDKMGSSSITGNKGVPASPRDGAPIELVAMQYSVLSWLGDLKQKGVIKYGGINICRNGKDLMVDFKEWALKMRDNFERCFWVPQHSSEDNLFQINPKQVNRRGVYKDVLGSSDGYTDYQLRPNVCIAMSYAPDLFDPEHAKVCVQNVAMILMEQGCMGIKTLDPKDRQYNGDYINSDDTDGWNYHQGPEWVWPVGFFLKAQLQFMGYKSFEEARTETMKYLIPHRINLENDKWLGLPELTNSHGTVCKDSCTTQAWSIATINDALRDLYYFKAQ